jgi:hypothetical protein
MRYNLLAAIWSFDITLNLLQLGHQNRFCIELLFDNGEKASRLTIVPQAYAGRLRGNNTAKTQDGG